MMVCSQCHRKENAIERFIQQYSERIRGVLSCFDRILFKGYLPLGWPDAMETLIAKQGLLIKDFKRFVMAQSERIQEHALRGFRNQDIRQRLYGTTGKRTDYRRQANRVWRLLARLHAHGLIAKVPRSRRWRVTPRGQRLISTILILHHHDYPKTLHTQAA